MNKIAPFLQNIQVVTSSRDVKPTQVTPGVDIQAFDRNMRNADGQSLKDVLGQYDLRNINRNDFFSLMTVLKDRNAVSDDVFTNLLAHSLEVFGEDDSDVKKDFIGSIEGQKSTFVGDGMDQGIINNVNNALAAANSIQFARDSGAEYISIDMMV